MNQSVLHSHGLANRLQSVLLLLALAGVLMLVGNLLWGGQGVLVLLVLGSLSLLFTPRMSRQMVLRSYGAIPLRPEQAPGLHAVVAELARRAGLSHVPSLAYVPSAMVNAFATGSRDKCVIAVTDGLLRSLDHREIVAVLGHEIAHVMHHDLWVMSFADVLSRLTHALSFVGQVALIVSLPLWMFSTVRIDWLALLVLISAPSLSALAQLGLSRTREFDADLSSARLTGDPAGMILALRKLERYDGSWWERTFLPGRRVPEPSYLRTHPPTEERVRRLSELATAEVTSGFPTLARGGGAPFLSGEGSEIGPPRWRLTGLWR